MNNPLISAIIPTFNRKERVYEAIQSVLNQSYTQFELLVIDDGSEDGTKKLVKNIKDARLTYIGINRSGVSAARNYGVKVAQGCYLAFLDSDDVWHEDKLLKQVEFHRKNPEMIISQTQEIWIRNNRRVNPKFKHTKPAGYIFPESLHLCTITPSSVFMIKDLFDSFGGFDEKMPACEDYDLWLRITAKYNVGLLNEQLLTKFGGHEDQLSQTFAAMDRFRIYSLGKIIQSNSLSEQQKQQAMAVFKQKAKILLTGTIKRHPENKKLIEFIKSLQDTDCLSVFFLNKCEEFLLSNSQFS